MRITTQQIFDGLLLGINRQQQAQAKATAQISSGYKFTQPSDDGLGFKKSVDIRHVQAGIKSSLAGLSTVKARLGASSNALSQMLPIIQRVQALAVQQANPIVSATGRQAAATEVSKLQDQLLALGNQKFEGESLFAGTATSTDAFAAFNAGTGVYTPDPTNPVTTISNVKQTANPNAVNDTYTLTLDSTVGPPATQRVISIKNSAGAEMLPGSPSPVPVTLSSGTNILDISVNGNGVKLSVDYTGPPDAVNTAGGVLKITSAIALGSYVGNTQDRLTAITSTQTIASNVRGDNTAFSKAFTAVKAFMDALAANNSTNIQSALGQLNTAGNRMAELTGETGGRLSAVTLREQVFQDLRVQTEQRRSQIEDADLAFLAAQLTKAQVALQASFSAMGRVGSLSLVNFLR